MCANSNYTKNSVDSQLTNIKELSKLFYVAKDNRNIDQFLKDCNAPEDRYERQIMIDIFKGKYNPSLKFYHLMNVAKASQKRVSLEQLTEVAGIDIYEQISELRNVEIIRGGIYWCDFGLGVDSVQGGKRPALVIQNNCGNKHSSTTLVAPITSRIAKSMLPTHVEFHTESGLPVKSIGLFEQITTVSKRQFLTNGYPENIGFVPIQKMIQEVNRAIEKSFELDKIKEEYNIQVVRDYLLAIESIQEAKLNNPSVGLSNAERFLVVDFADYFKKCGKNMKEEMSETFYNKVMNLQFAR